MNKICRTLAWLVAAGLPCFLSMPDIGAIDQDILNDIFGSSDGARYGDYGTGALEDEWEEVPVTLLPEDKDCQPIQSPRDEPSFMTIHEELKAVEVIKETGNKKCDYYAQTQGFECVPYYQCGGDGQIITDGAGLIDIRFGGSDVELAVLDSTDLMCPGSLDVCCANPDFEFTTLAPLEEPTTPGYGNNGDGGADGKDGASSEESGERGTDGGYGNEGQESNGDYEDGGGEGEEGESEEEGEGKNGDGGDAVCVGDCSAPLQYKPSCGRRNSYGLGVRVQNYKEDESQFGEWPHICAVLNVQDVDDTGYGTTEQVKVFTGGASLVAPGAVLTAAHKVHEFVSDPGQLLVRCGEWDTQTNSEPLPHQDRKVKEIILHPQYNKRNLGNTAAILILEEDFELAQHIDTICLPDINDSDEQNHGEECYVKGWGKDKWEEGDYQVVLKEVQVPVVDTASCLDALKKTKLGRRFRLDPSFMCAGGEVGKDACKGDGGGPLVCPSKNNPDQYVQVGIVAWGIGCGTTTPGVYTSVEKIGCWIDFVLKCALGDRYQLRYGAECNVWHDKISQQIGGTKAGAFLDTCNVRWEDNEKLSDGRDNSYAVDPDPYAVETIPQKIQKSTTGY